MFKSKVPKFRIENLTRDNTKGKTVYFLISGFLTEEDDKREEWAEMVSIM